MVLLREVIHNTVKYANHLTCPTFLWLMVWNCQADHRINAVPVSFLWCWIILSVLFGIIMIPVESTIIISCLSIYIYLSIYPVISHYIPIISPYIPIYPVISHCTPIYPHISPWYNIFLVDHQTVSPKWHGPCLGYPNQVSTASPKSPSMEPVTHKKWVESWKMWPKHKTLSAIMGEQWDICINVCVFIVLFKWKMWILPKQTWLNRQTNWIWRSNWWYFMIWWYCQHFGWVTYHPIR